MRAPEFWAKDGVAAQALAPLGALYALAGRIRRAAATPVRLPVPVICVGNVTVGGTGKTPTALAVADLLRASGHKPWFLTRGYGGREAGPLVVDPARQDATAVGDEALLLSAGFPTVVSQDRPAGGRLAVAQGADVIVMDDGFQNPSLSKTFSILVFDGGAGLGNGRVIPAGPLREPLAEAAAHADLALIVGVDATGLRTRLPAELPVLDATLIPNADDAAALAGKPILAFAGIGRPEKFFESLRDLGADLRGTVAFADHHPFTATELANLRAEALRLKADLATTAKDLSRLAPADRAGILVLRVVLTPDDPAGFAQRLNRALA